MAVVGYRINHGLYGNKFVIKQQVGVGFYEMTIQHRLIYEVFRKKQFEPQWWARITNKAFAIFECFERSPWATKPC